MKYYLHDSSAFDDEKITQLYIKFGYEGLGLFYTLLEKFAKQEKPIRTNVLKHQLNVGKKLEKCWNFMEEIGLIQSNNGETFNEQLLNFSEKYQVKKEKNKIRLQEWRENQRNTKNETHYESVSNTPKVNESKGNESKGNIDTTAIATKKSLEDRLNYFKGEVYQHVSQYGIEMLDDFIRYWSEPNRANNPKMKFELNKTWSLSGRLATWHKNSTKFKPANQSKGMFEAAEELRRSLEEF